MAEKLYVIPPGMLRAAKTAFNTVWDHGVAVKSETPRVVLEAAFRWWSKKPEHRVFLTFEPEIPPDATFDGKFNGPHILTDQHGWTARCCGNPHGCKWCANDKGFLEAQKRTTSVMEKSRETMRRLNYE